jgi:hypothetical protein
MDEPTALPEIDLANVSRMQRRPRVAAIVLLFLVLALTAFLANLGARTQHENAAIAFPLVGALYASPFLYGIYLVLRRRELMPRNARRSQRLHTQDGVLFLGEEPLCRREDVSNATAAMSDQEAVVHIELRRGEPIGLYVGSLDDGRALLRALGADVTRRAHDIRVPSGLPFFPMRVSVGVEGIDIDIPFSKPRFIPLREIAGVERTQSGLRVHRHDAAHVDLVVQQNAFLPDLEGARVAERLCEAIDAQRSMIAPVIDPTLLDRGETPIALWIERLRGVAKVATFRQAGLIATELWQIVENAAIPPARRAAAAVALAPDLDEKGKDRLRIAAVSSALPRLRMALDAAADDDRATIETALAEVLEEHRDHS